MYQLVSNPPADFCLLPPPPPPRPPPSGATIVDTVTPPAKIFFIVEGEAKLVWVTDDPSRLPPQQAFFKKEKGDAQVGCQWRLAVARQVGWQ